MASLGFKKSSSSKPANNHEEIIMGINCRRHPKHKQSQGVCSLCLREKLSHALSLSATSTSRAAALGSSSSSSSSLSSLSSYYSSSEASSCSSPPVMSTNKNKFGGGKSTSLFAKRRSLAFAPRMGNQEAGDRSRKNGHGGLFSRILSIRPRNVKIRECSVHSRTTREIIVT